MILTLMQVTVTGGNTSRGTAEKMILTLILPLTPLILTLILTFDPDPDGHLNLTILRGDDKATTLTLILTLTPP